MRIRRIRNGEDGVEVARRKLEDDISDGLQAQPSKIEKRTL